MHKIQIHVDKFSTSIDLKIEEKNLSKANRWGWESQAGFFWSLIDATD